MVVASLTVLTSIFGSVATIIAAVASIGAVALGVNNHSKIGNVRDDVNTVHEAVNNTAQKQNRRADQLTAALTEAGVQVPPRDPPEGDEHGAPNV